MPVVAPTTEGPIDLGAVAVAADATTGVAIFVGPSLGAVAISASTSVAVALARQGTLVDPYMVASSGTYPVDFNGAFYVDSDPVPMSGPALAPSIWFEFTSAAASDWLATASGFASGATIELYQGPPGAGPDDLTFLGTDGVVTLDLGAVAITTVGAVTSMAVQTQVVNLGAVTMSANLPLAGVLT